jgi:HK97 family phage portal protein
MASFSQRVRAALVGYRNPNGLSAVQTNTVYDMNDPTFRLIATGGMTPGLRSIGEKQALTLPVIMRAAEILCGVFAMTPLIYYRKTPNGRERAEDSSLYRMFHDAPNNTQSPFLFKELMLGDLILAGGSFNFIHRDGLFRPSGLSRLLPTGVTIAQTWDEQDGAELFYDARLPNSTHRRLTRAELWHIPGFTRDGLVGLNRLAFMGDAISSALTTSEFARRYWENNATPGTVITIDSGNVTDEQRQAIKTDWKRMFSGARNAGEPAVVSKVMKVENIQQTNEDSQFLETRNFQVLEIARAFGVPPHLLFELSRATFSNIEQQSLEFITYHMMPHYERVAAAATFAFAEPGHYFEFMPDALLKGDIKSRYEAYNLAVGMGALNPNEVRRRENMNDREGGDAYRVASGAQVEGQAMPSPAPAPVQQ